jgi:hypothetical protein
MANETSNLNMTLPSGSDVVDIEVLNTNFKTLDELGVDYIVEHGVKNSWTYRRWKSKIYECWKNATASLNPDTNYTQVVDSGDLPVTFSSTPTIVASGYQDGYAAAHTGYCYANTTSYSVHMAELVGSGTPHVSIYVIGTVG